MKRMTMMAGFAAAAIVLAPTVFAQDSFNDPRGQTPPAYPQQQQVYPPQQQGWAQQQQEAYPPPQQAYPQQPHAYPPAQQTYPPQSQAYPPQPQQAYPPQPQMGNPQHTPYGQQPQGRQGNAQPPNFAAAAQMENQDFGVRPVASLHAGAPHGPTPTSIPGGTVISTQELATRMTQNPQGLAVLDILGGPETLPMATFATPAAAPGSCSDQVQQNYGNYLQQVTGGNKAMLVVVYCQSTHCWMSYNAALRAINMGYTNVFWYRGGIEAWQAAGLPVASQNAYMNQGGVQPRN